MTSPTDARPRLLFTQSRIAQLRGEIEAGDPTQPLWTQILEQADALLERDFFSESEADAPDTQHGNYGPPSSQISDMGLVLGLAYQLTGETRFAEKLRDALLHYSGYNKWYGRGLQKNDPPWQSELNTVRFCFGFAVGYDAIHDALSSDERKTIAGALVRLGILPTLEDWVLPERRVHALDSMGHNWWSVCVAQAGMAALSLLGEDSRANEWVEAVSEGLSLWFDYRGNILQNKCPNFDADGAFYESVNYANYALAEYLLFRLGYANVVGTPPDIPLLARTGRFFVHSCYPTASGLLTVDFGDGHLHADAGRAVTLLRAAGFDTPELRWYSARAKPGERAFTLLAPPNPTPPQTPRLDRSVLYPEIGWAMLRSSWAPDATLLAIKSGFTWNHAHEDAGSFILFHQGKPLVIDSGTCSYGRREYGEYYFRSRAHNVVLFNGEGQAPDDRLRGVKHPGRLHHLVELGDFRYVYADATGPMSRWFSRNYRHFVWIGNVILVIDDVLAHEPGTIEWLLHYGGRAEEAEGGTGIDIVDGDARLTVRPLFPAQWVRAERDGLADHDPDHHVPYLSFSEPEPTRDAKFVTAFMLSGDTAVPEPACTSGAEWLGVTIRDAGEETDVYLNLRADGRRMHRNSNNVVGGWETDAYLLALTRPAGSTPGATDAIRRLFIAEGSYVRRDGRVVIDSLSKVFGGFHYLGGMLDVQLQGQPVISAAVGVNAPPKEVRVNGQRSPLVYDARGRTIRVTSRQDRR